MFIYKFAQSSEWPGGSIKDSFKIVVLKNPYLCKYLSIAAETKTINGFPVDIEYISSINDFTTGQMLYADYFDGVSAEQLFDAIGDQSVALVTEGYDYNTTMFNFIIQGNLIKYQMNRSNLSKHGIIPSKALENLATEVNEEDWKTELERLRKDLQVEKQKSAQLQDVNENLNVEVTTLKTDIQTLEEKIDALNEEIIEKRSELSEVFDRIGVQKDVYQKLVKSLDSKERELTESQKELQSKNEELETKELAIQVSEKRLSEQREQIELANEEILVVESRMSNALKLLENQKLVSYAVAIIAFIILILGALAFVNYRRQKSQAQIIAKQRDEVESQRDEIRQQHEQLEEKNQEILDSIEYAKRIQTAILPPDRIVKEYLNQSFILYKPKDVVAGDFYWMETVGDVVYYAAADCTGHGVPGAMVSVICVNGLNRAVREFGLRQPAEILDKTRELVIKEFEKSEEEVKDGMDISLCALNSKTKELQWAGANNPLWIVRKGAEEVEEVKPDKQPIGRYESEKPFTNHVVQLNDGDTIYTFSDGYPDQFGGESGKKYKSGKFKSTLLKLAHQPVSDQRALLDEEFESWRGEHEQIDDVCVIGVKIT
ncbi:MAG: YfiR/HmsC family protein [Flavobacteriales bacterium]